MIRIPKILRSNGIEISADGLTLKSPEICFYKWEEITNIFPFMRKKNLVVINEDKIVSRGLVYPDEAYGDVKQKVNYIFKTWQEKIEAEKQPEIYEYPNCYKKFKKLPRKNICLEIFGGLFFIFISIMAFLEIREGGEIFGLKDYFVPLLGVSAISLGVYHLIKLKHKMINAVKLNEGKLEIIYDDGTTRICDLSQVKRHTFNEYYNNEKLVFRDGLVIKDLEVLSYWPILRKKLLLRLSNSNF